MSQATDMPGAELLLQFAQLDSFKFDVELQAQPADVFDEASVPVEPDLPPQAQSRQARSYHGSSRPLFATSQEWQSIGPAKRVRLLAWVADPTNVAQLEAIKNGKIDFKEVMRRVESQKAHALLASSSASLSSLSSPSASSPVFVVEFACSDASAISLVCELFGFNGHRLTKTTYDLTTKKGIEDATTLINGFPADAIVHLFGSVPCTSWSSWQYINLAKHPSLAPKINIARRQSLLMVRHFCTLARLVLKRGDRCSVSFEWPKGSSGWKHKSVIAQLQAIGLCHSTQVDGCAVGVAELKSGNPIPKPWTIKSSSAIVVAHLSTLRCPGQSATHIHGTCQGSDTLRTGFYTQHFATEIVSALKKHHEAHEPLPQGTCTAEACKASVGSLSPSSSVVSSLSPTSVLVLPAASVDKVIAPSNAYELAAENALDNKSA